MTAVAVFVVLLAAAFVQGLLPALGFLGMAKAPLLLSVVIYYSLSHGRFTMLLAAMAGGIIHDSLGFTPLGCTSFCFCLTGLSVQAARELLFRDSLLTGTALTAVGAALLTLMTWLFLEFGEFGQAPAVGGSGWWVLAKAGGAAILAIVAVPPVFGLARGLDSLIGNTDTLRA
jgi:rod shape-determining protein MreD